jgi:hypothetical protein
MIQSLYQPTNNQAQMKLKNRLLLVLLILSCAINSSKGSHLMGGDVSYVFVGYNPSTNLYTYKISTKIYRYCDSTGVGGTPAALDNQMLMGVYPQNPFQPNANKNLYTTLTLPLISANYITPPSVNPNCTVGASVCVQEGVYELTVNLPPSTGGYHLIIDRCCRNYTITNINVANPPGSGEAFYAFLPPTSTPNNSPVFATAPVPYICAGDTTSILNSAFDPDGDSLTYSFQIPYKGLSSSNNAIPNPPATYTWPIPSCTYVTGYSLSAPFGASGYANINLNNGLTSYYIPSQGFYVVAIEIKEYRNGVLIGVTRRDIQLIVIPCTPNSAPTLSASAGNTNFSASVGETLCFPVAFSDADGDSMFLSANGPIFDSTQTTPVATLTNAAGAGSVSSQFCWSIPCGSGLSSQQFVVSALDNGCPPKTTNLVYTINVSGIQVSGLTGADTACAGSQGNIYTVDTTGASSFQWMVTGGTVSGPSNGSEVLIDWDAFGGTGMISVVAYNSFGCPSDTLSKSVLVLNPQLDAGPDQSLCASDSVQIGTPSNPDYSYSWTPGTGLTDSTASSTWLVLSSAGQFNYTLTANYLGCEVTDDVSITSYPLPVITFTGINAVCESAAPFLLNTATPVGGTYSGIAVTNNTFDPSASGTGSFQINYSFTSVNGCSSNDNTTVFVNANPAVSLNSLATTCVNGAPVVLNGGSPAGGVYSGPGVSNGQFDPSALPQGTYTYSYTYTDTTTGCSDSASAQITIGSAASVSISSSPGIGCAPNTIYIGYGNQTIPLTAHSSVQGVTYQWYLDGIAITGANDSVYLASSGGQYGVVVTDAGGCSSALSDSSANITIQTVDIRCGQNGQKVLLCHVPPGNPSNPQTLCIAPSAVPAHLSEHSGDCLGACSSSRLLANYWIDGNQVSVQPNPFRDQLTVGFNSFSAGRVRVYLFDMQGRQLKSLFSLLAEADHYYEKSINLEDLPEGAYTLRFEGPEGTEHVRLIHLD